MIDSAGTAKIIDFGSVRVAELEEGDAPCLPLRSRLRCASFTRASERMAG